MAYDDDLDEDTRTADEVLAAVKRTLSDLDERVKKMGEAIEDDNAKVRMDLTLARREQAEMRVAFGRLQSRFDNQLMALVLANIASGVGVAALMLGATRAFG